MVCMFTFHHYIIRIIFWFFNVPLTFNTYLCSDQLLSLPKINVHCRKEHETLCKYITRLRRSGGLQQSVPSDMTMGRYPKQFYSDKWVANTYTLGCLKGNLVLAKEIAVKNLAKSPMSKFKTIFTTMRWSQLALNLFCKILDSSIIRIYNGL